MVIGEVMAYSSEYQHNSYPSLFMFKTASILLQQDIRSLIRLYSSHIHDIFSKESKKPTKMNERTNPPQTHYHVAAHFSLAKHVPGALQKGKPY